MKYVVDRIVELILGNEPSPDTETMIRVDGFESLAIYERVAAKVTAVLENEGISVDVKLAKNKWYYFIKNTENTTILQSMSQHSWIADAESITYYRNLHTSNVLVLLGTEDEEDKGGLANCYSITPELIAKTLRGKYHKVFSDNDSFTDSDRNIIDKLYKDLFEFVAIDICKLSDIADTWADKISNSKDFIELFFEELPTWGLPMSRLELPTAKELMGRRNCLRSAYSFIKRQLFSKKMTITQYNKYMNKIDYYDSGKAELAKYTSDHECWEKQSVKDYAEFAKVVKEFIRGENIDINTEILLGVDFCIVEDVLDIGIPVEKKPPKDKVTTLVGEPLEVFAHALFLTLAHIGDADVLTDNIEFSFTQAEIVCVYSSTEDDEEKQQLLDAWKVICVHCGGIVEYLNKRMWNVNGNDVKLESKPGNFLSPMAALYFIEDDVRVKPAGANKSISKIYFSTIYKVDDIPYHHDFQWKFGIDNSWDKNFGELCLQDFCLYKDGNYIPVTEISKINTLILSKSEEEFFDRLNESDINFKFNLAEHIDKKVQNNEKEISARFDEVGKAFSAFVYCVARDGFYTCIARDDSELIKLGKKYTDLGEYLRKRTFSENLKWVLDAYINAFNIIESTNVFDSEQEISACIVPAWHPATLEKLNDQKIFFLDGCEEWWNEVQQTGVKISEKDISIMINGLLQMSVIQSTLDIFPSYGQVYFGAIASYGAFSLYGRSDIKNENHLRDMIHKDAIFDDDFDKNEISLLNDNAKMIYGILSEYAKAFPNSANNLSVVFIDPSELQPIVAAIYKYIEVRRKESELSKVNISLRILVRPENKGGRNYLAYWMDEFFSEDENVNIRTYLNEWKSKTELEKILNGNNDIAFVMDILKVNNLGFIPMKKDISLAPSQCRFPIVYKPTPKSYTSVKRAIELSQPQFRAAYEHTQIVRYRNNMEKIPSGKYIAAKEVTIDSEGQSIVHFLHEKAYWVVCIDSGMDGALLRNDNIHKTDYSIIGFSTGKGAYGQYNLTITARKTILDTICKKLENRLFDLFKWDKKLIKKAAKVCMDEARGLDGISLLSATNPKDENIREFMAYVLTALREKNLHEDSALKIIIHLDSYKHWFGSEIEKDVDDSESRPDFLILEAFLTDDDKLKLRAIVTECKTAALSNAEAHKEKALKQVEHGIKRLSKVFDPNSGSVKRRHWFSQLYRALTFAQITFSNNTEEFEELSAKLRTILDGNFEIEWSGRVLGFWLDMDGVEEIETVAASSGIVIYDVPQKIIQSLLLKGESSTAEFVSIDSKAMIEDEDRQVEIEKRENELEEEIADFQRGRKRSSLTFMSKGNYAKLYDEKEQEKTEPEMEKQIEVVEDDTVRKIDTEQQEESVEMMDILKAVSTVNLEDIRVLIGKNKVMSDVYWEFGSSQMANRHLLITGTSGQGKTYSIQTMLYELAKSNISSVIFDYTEGFRLDQLEPEFVESMNNKIDQHIVKVQGVPINPFKKQEQDFAGMKIIDTPSDVAGRFANILTHVYGFGEQQYAAIYEATRVGMEKYGENMNMEYFRKELEGIQAKNSSAKTVVSKMTPFFHSISFNIHADFDWSNILYAPEAKMNIFQLTMIDREMQVIVTELMLWDAWYYTKKYGSKDKPFVVVLDEAQNLSHKENSPSKAILTEGRKFGWSAWFATQSLKVLADDEVIRLMQAAFKLYFKPTDEEIVKLSKQLDPTNGSLWLGALKGLKKGQCIVIGDRVKEDGVFGSVKPTITNITSFKERRKDGPTSKCELSSDV
ncbi:ATP-binding protein [Hungatella hathewayi]|uniref:ATP-binding protein n=1 Tax=Hungatella hathewayi TaxID=154046 RepID=UPI003567F3D5